ncbi:MAG TPA: phage tail sheath C-terminal domain-containing protein [Prolixibacteraceae bacterium]|nr:phage tail sheath C-terminal domain-containing protein [Prolixibacteraceae bacterium]
MAQRLMTPGVYIEEVNGFPGSVVEVATAIPAFIGYTEKASRNGKSLINKPTKIKSFAEYRELFGLAFNPKFKLDLLPDGQKAQHEITINGTRRAINYLTDHDSYMYSGIQLFYNNGGGSCYIVSVGTYSKADDVVHVVKEELEAGLITLLKEQEPTMIVIPDVVKLKDDSYDVYKKVLAHCSKMQSRVAILDIYNGDQARIEGNAPEDIIANFRELIGTEYLNYAAAYYPWLNTNIVQNDKITFGNLDVSVELNTLLPEKQALEVVTAFSLVKADFKSALLKDKPADLAKALTADEPDGLDQMVADGKMIETFDAAAFNALDIDTLKETKSLLDAYISNKNRNYHLGLIATSPTYTNLLNEIRAVLNLLPPSAAMAGIYTMVDNNKGVWKSPANISLNSVISPSTNITHDDQENLNVDATSGKSINAIRTFPGIGTLVWGGRTLDGNSLDWKYINVRRTMIMLEQSIKMALRSYVFEPNDANTWVSVRSMIVNYLTEKWKQGALAGSSPDDAFEVQVGLGITMTGLDILEGKMRVSVKLAIVRPAEFIVVTFEQQMQKS